MSGEGSVYRRKSDGRWVAALSVGSRSDRVIYRRYARSRTDARAELDALRAGLTQPTATTSLGDYLVRWVNDARNIRPTTRHGYQAVVTYHLVPRIGHLPIGALTPIHVEQLLADLEGTMAPATARNVHVILRRALGQAVRAGLISKNVASREFVDSPKVPVLEPEALTGAQVRRLLDACRGDRLEALFILAVATGLRQGELLGLAWEDIDFDGGYVHVRKELVRRDGRYHREEPKTERSKRVVPLALPVVAAMRAHRERTVKAGFVPVASGPVFTNLDGGELSGSWLTHHFYGLLAEAGIQRIPFKNLRTTFSSRLAEAGVSDVVIARLMGHARTHTTRKHYIADRPEDALDAVARLVG
jgi:integrase